MLALFGKMFGSDRALDSVVQSAVKGLDALVYTDEEKATDAAKARAAARDMVIQWMVSTSGQNLARRFIALTITLTWLSMYVATLVLSLIAVWHTEHAAALRLSAEIVGTFGERMNGAMMLILGFYFAAPHLGSIVEGAMNKFGNAKGNP